MKNRKKLIFFEFINKLLIWLRLLRKVIKLIILKNFKYINKLIINNCLLIYFFVLIYPLLNNTVIKFRNSKVYI